MCDGFEGLARGCVDVDALADAEVEERVSVYGTLLVWDVAEAEVVKRMSALREVGKSLRSTFVSSRWCVGLLSFLPWGESVSDHASPLRKSVFAVLTAAVDVVLSVSRSSGFEGVVIR